MGKIYVITNILEGCKDFGYNYIGQTRGDINKRFKQHCRCALSHKDNNYFHNAILKYGCTNFKVDLLYDTPDEYLNNLEIDTIKKYKSMGQAQYNIAEGGYNYPFKYFSKEKKQLISQKSRNTYLNKTPEEIAEINLKISKAVSGKGNGMWGKHHSDISKEKISTNRKGKCTGDNNPSKREYVREKISKKLKGKKLTEDTRRKLSESHSNEKGSNYGKHYGDSSNHRSVTLIKPDGTTMDFTSKLECGEYLGYKYGGNVPLNRTLKSKDSRRSGCKIIYKD